MRNRRAQLGIAASLAVLAACTGQGRTPEPSPVATPPPPAIPTIPSPISPAATPAELLFATPAGSAPFQGAKAMEYVRDQMHFGPRPTGSDPNKLTGDYIIRQLQAFGWSVTEQTFDYRGVQVRNILGARGDGPTILLGAHYDTRRVADRDPVDPTQPMPGANDGASGVAVLLELARVLNVDYAGHRLELAFFDAEDNGGLDNWDWIVGSSYMAEHLDVIPEAMVLVDMVGDADQQLYWESNSSESLRSRLWSIAAALGYEAYFIPQVGHTLIDDHIPFLSQGIPAVDIIDFDYPYWHTGQDLADKLSPDSLERVGRTLQAWLETGAR